MKYKYTGDREAVTCWGITFPAGKAVEVTDGFALSKLAANSHFAEVKPRKVADVEDVE